jgi:HEAT repeat protein
MARLFLFFSILFMLACASAPPTLAPSAEAPRVPAPNGAVEVLDSCHFGEPVTLIWNPAAAPRLCQVGDEAAMLVEPLGLKPTTSPLSSSDRDSLECIESPLTIEASIAAEVPRLADSDPVVREQAAKALSQLGPAASAVAPALAERVRIETESGPLYVVATGLVHLLGSQAVPLLVDALETRSDEPARTRIAETILRLGPAAGRDLAPRLSSPMVAEAFFLPDLVAVDLDAVRGRILALSEATGHIDARALAGYLERRPEDTEVGRIAVDSLATSSDPKLRYRLVEAVAHLRSLRAVVVLVSALRDPDRSVVYRAVEAIGLIARDAPALMSLEVADAVASLIPTEDRSRLWYATMTLGRIGIDSPAVRAALMTAGTSNDQRIRIIATAARTQLERGLSEPDTFREGILSADERLFGLTLARIEELGPLAAPLVDALSERLTVTSGNTLEDRSRIKRLTEVLLAIGPTARPTLRSLAAGHTRLDLRTWLKVVDVVGESAAVPLAEALSSNECGFGAAIDKEHEAIVKMRLGKATRLDRARVIAELASPSSDVLAHKILPHVRALRLGEWELAAIAWLSEHHADYWARKALAEMAAQLR